MRRRKNHIPADLPSTLPQLKKAGLNPDLLVSKTTAKKFKIAIGDEPVAMRYFSTAKDWYGLYQVLDPQDPGLLAMQNLSPAHTNSDIMT